jgi:hypothetical protein
VNVTQRYGMFVRRYRTFGVRRMLAGGVSYDRGAEITPDALGAYLKWTPGVFMSALTPKADMCSATRDVR